MRVIGKSAEQLERVVARLGGPEGDAPRLMAGAGEAAALARRRGDGAAPRAVYWVRRR